MRHSTHTPRSWLLALVGAASLGLALPAIAQSPLRDDAPVVVETLSASELQDVIGPVALYPDDLLAVVLPASAFPLQIVQATRFLDDLERDNSLKPDPAWDESVVALLNYPDVLRLMNNDLDWTYDLGAAVVNQQPDVIEAIETFRDRAYNAGNLKSDDRQVVEYEEDRITITPIEREVIYVPYYEPERVVVVQPQPVYHYYPQPFPVYFYPYPSFHRFNSGFFWGVSNAYQIGWNSRHLNVHFLNYASHPFFGRNYANSFYYHHRFQPARYRFRPVANSRGGYANSRNRNYRGDQWRPVSRRNASSLNRTSQRAARINRDTYTRTLKPRDPRDRTALNQRTGSRSLNTRQVAPKTGYGNNATRNQRTTRSATTRTTRTTANTRTASRDTRTTARRGSTTRATTDRSTRQYRSATPAASQSRQVASTRRSTTAPTRSQVTRQTTTRTRTTTTRSAPRQSAPAPQRQSAPAPQRQSAPAAQQRSAPARAQRSQSQSRSNSRQGSSRSSSSQSRNRR